MKLFAATALALVATANAYAFQDRQTLINNGPWSREGGNSTWEFTQSEIRDTRYNGNIVTVYTMNYELDEYAGSITYRMISGEARQNGQYMSQQPEVPLGQSYTIPYRLEGNRLILNNSVVMIGNSW